MPALVLGDTSAMTPELQQSFQTTGLTHLTAVSGANLTLLLAFLIFGAKWLGVRGRWLRVVGLGGVVVFVALCRTEPSVLRAAAMGLVALAALGAGGGRKGLRHLAVAVLVLVLLDPFLARSIGFALSVLASARHRLVGVVVGPAGQLAAAAVGGGGRGPPGRPPGDLAGGRGDLGGGQRVGTAGQRAGRSVRRDRRRCWASHPPGCRCSAPGLAAVAGWGASWCAQLIIWIAHAGAALPGASWQWPATPVALVVLAAAAVGLGVSVRLLARHRWPAVGASVLLITAMLTGPVQPGWPPRDWRVVSCDVGQGDGLLVRAGAGQAVVVDVGPDQAAMRRCLSALRIKAVPVLVLTHFHADHVDGLGAVVGRLPVGEVWVSPYASPVAEAAEVRSLVLAAGSVVRSPPVGETGRVGQVWWQVLGPVGTEKAMSGVGAEQGESAESGMENDASLVLRLGVGDLTVLLTGDVEPAGQARILATGADLRADVLKLPHHGSSRQDPAFFAATGARVAIASAGRRNSYGHPAPSTVRLATGLGMTVLRTDTHGSIAVTEHDGRLGAVTQTLTGSSEAIRTCLAGQSSSPYSWP